MASKKPTLKTMFDETGRTNVELAEALDVTPQTITMWKRGALPMIPKLYRIAQLLKKPLDEVVAAANRGRQV